MTPNTACPPRSSAGTSRAVESGAAQSSPASATSTARPCMTRRRCPSAGSSPSGYRPLRRQGRHRRVHRPALDHHLDPASPLPDLRTGVDEQGAGAARRPPLLFMALPRSLRRVWPASLEPPGISYRAGRRSAGCRGMTAQSSQPDLQPPRPRRPQAVHPGDREKRKTASRKTGIRPDQGTQWRTQPRCSRDPRHRIPMMAPAGVGKPRTPMFGCKPRPLPSRKVIWAFAYSGMQVLRRRGATWELKRVPR